jgi:hypothetical protein
VADTSRTTRSADQPSGCIHDRPAVNGRAQSPSRLKPADPNGACTQPIDSGAWAPHSPLQGAWGFSPGLQPRAHGWRPLPLGSTSVPRRRCHSPALASRRVRHRLIPTGRGRVSPNGTAHFAHQQPTAQSCRGEALPRPPRRMARPNLARHTAPPPRCRAPRTTHLHQHGPALAGRRVRHRLTPTGTMAAVRPRRPNGQHWGRTPVLVGATRCVARRTTARQYAARQTPPRGSRARSSGPTTVGIASPAGPAGQAPPDPDQTSAVTSGHTRAAPGRALRPADPPPVPTTRPGRGLSPRPG